MAGVEQTKEAITEQILLITENINILKRQKVELQRQIEAISGEKDAIQAELQNVRQTVIQSGIQMRDVNEKIKNLFIELFDTRIDPNDPDLQSIMNENLNQSTNLYDRTIMARAKNILSKLIIEKTKVEDVRQEAKQETSQLREQLRLLLEQQKDVEKASEDAYNKMQLYESQRDELIQYLQNLLGELQRVNKMFNNFGSKRKSSLKRHKKKSHRSSKK